MSVYTAAQARADYRLMINDHGEDIVLTRLPATTKTVKARLLRGPVTKDAGTVQQNTRRFLIVAADVIAGTAFPVPFLLKQDRIVWNGKTLVIMSVDDTTRRIAGELIAYDIEAAGA